MTLSSTTSKVTYNDDGTTTVWVEATQYTLTGGAGATGTLTVKTTPTDYTPAQARVDGR